MTLDCLKAHLGLAPLVPAVPGLRGGPSILFQYFYCLSYIIHIRPPLVRVRGGWGLKEIAAPPQLDAAIAAFKSLIIFGKSIVAKMCIICGNE